MNRVRKSPELSRRHFLRAAGGAAVALPLLSSLRAGAAGETFPKRLVLMYTPNGVISDSWWPLNVKSETSWDLNTIHKPLSQFKDRLLFLGGVDLTVTNDGTGWEAWPFGDPEYLILNIALGGWGGKVNDSQLPARMEVKYVRYYEQAEGATAGAKGK